MQKFNVFFFGRFTHDVVIRYDGFCYRLQISPRGIGEWKTVRTLTAEEWDLLNAEVNFLKNPDCLKDLYPLLAKTA